MLVSDYYPCTDAAVKIDLKYFQRMQDRDIKVIYMIIIICSAALVMITVCQFYSHRAMIMKWYKENPTDGKEIARSI